MKIFFRLSIFGIVAFFPHWGITEKIVPECTFTGTSGFCAEMVGRFIRPEYNPNIRALYIVNCDLTALSSDDFARFQSLSTLHINNSTLPLTAYRNLLSDLKELKDLQITHSNLSDDIKYMFVNNTGLNNLSLQGNKITQIRKDTFSHLTQLETIDVSNNDISEVDQDAFVTLKHLKKLVLSKNKIGENFDPDSLSLSQEQCGVCGGTCPVNATSSCKVNEKTDHLWKAFEEKYDILFLEDNPICSKVGLDDGPEKTTDPPAAAGQPSAGCVPLQEDACEKHEARRKFFTTACTQSSAARRRSGRNHGEDLSSAPELEDGEEVGDLPESAPEMEDHDDPPAPRTSGEAAGAGADDSPAEGGGQRDPYADGAGEPAVDEEPSSAVDSDRDAAADDVNDEDGDAGAGDDDVAAADDNAAAADDDTIVGLPPSSVEVEEVQAESLSQFSSRSVLLGAIVGVVAAIGVLAALVVYFRTKRSYRSIQQNDEDPDKIELKVIKNHESQAFSWEEATPLTRIPTQ